MRCYGITESLQGHGASFGSTRTKKQAVDMRLLMDIARQEYAGDNLYLEGQPSKSKIGFGLLETKSLEILVINGVYSINVIPSVPKDLRGLRITIVTLGPLDYVTGIRLIGKDGNAKIAGYTSSSREVIVAIKALHSFVAAMGPGGLRALQVHGQLRRTIHAMDRTLRERSKF